MRCLKSVNTVRRDNYHRTILKGVLSWFVILCLLFLVHNFLVPGNFSPEYNGVAFLALIFIYPLHKALYILASFKYRSNISVQFVRRFYVLPCIQIKVKHMMPKRDYLFSLLFPFFAILFLLIVWMMMVPVWNSPVFLILMAVHFGISYPAFVLANNIRNLPKSCFIEEAKRGYSVLISD
ncbi:DUF3267 domain-containing protein [Listeria aquatica]|uniref:DUF3267 domain-containing protein n=1 Tax=Listeria aquatica TaxID=1494960 RepID=UPI003EF1C540